MYGISRTIAVSALLVCAIIYAQPGFEYLPVDDFEDTSAWIKGDPTTDMEQREVGYAPSIKYAKEGKQSLAFMVRVDWTEKPGVQYAKGWPMISRLFDAYDWVWVYASSAAKTLPYNPDNAALYGDVLEAALVESEQQTGD